MTADASDPGLGPGREFDLVRRIAARLGTNAHGLGDDCATLEWPGGRLVLSSDLSIEGVHFRRKWLRTTEIGWRAAAGAISDLAAAGASPVGVLASVGLPEGLAEEVEELMAGVAQACAAVGAVVLGGDLAQSAALTIDICALGSADEPVGRGGARPGDSLWVTGRLGGARAALTMWRRELEPPAEAREAFAHPVPRIDAGRWLSAHDARAMIDLSDGLAGDVAHLATRSGVRATVDLGLIPRGPGVDQAAADLDEEPAVFAAVGGEDYELLAALPGDFSEADAAGLREECGVALIRIGRIERGSGVSLQLDGVPRRIAGFDHFG